MEQHCKQQFTEALGLPHFKTETEKKSISNTKSRNILLSDCMCWITRNSSTRENMCLKSKTALNLNINANPKKSPSLQRAQKGGITFCLTSNYRKSYTGIRFLMSLDFEIQEINY